MELFWPVFLILTVAHPIADFVVQNRISRKAHWFACLNPLHYLWDNLFNKHSEYIDPKFILKDFEALNLSLVNNNYFWFWLGIDQIGHVILNIILALFLDWLFISVF